MLCALSVQGQCHYELKDMSKKTVVAPVVDVKCSCGGDVIFTGMLSMK